MAGYIRANHLDEALKLRANGSLTLLAGGTDIYPARSARVGWGDMRQSDILDIGALHELKGIRRIDGGWHIGALTTWSAIASADLPPLFNGLQAAARVIGGRQVQNRGTIAGNLCTASPAGDSIPCLLSLDACIELQSTGNIRQVPLTEFITGYRRTLIAPNEIATGVIVPAAEDNERGSFLKLGARHYLVISIAMVAGTLSLETDGRIRRVRLAVGACGPAARRLESLEARLTGMHIGDAVVQPEDLALLDPIDDIRASAAFRRDAARILLNDILTDLRTMAGGDV